MTEALDPETMRAALANADAIVDLIAAEQSRKQNLAMDDQVSAAADELGRQLGPDKVALLFAAFGEGELRGGEADVSAPRALAVQILFRGATRCPHLASPRPAVYFGGTRRMACLSCTDWLLAGTDKATYLASKDCEVCGGAAHDFRPVVIHHGPVMFTLQVGECCDRYFDVDDAPVVARRVGRNEPCPCGSGRKFKHCHGASPTR
jgi:hypothetical protein